MPPANAHQGPRSQAEKSIMAGGGIEPPSTNSFAITQFKFQNDGRHILQSIIKIIKNVIPYFPY